MVSVGLEIHEQMADRATCFRQHRGVSQKLHSAPAVRCTNLRRGESGEQRTRLTGVTARVPWTRLTRCSSLVPSWFAGYQRAPILSRRRICPSSLSSSAAGHKSEGKVANQAFRYCSRWWDQRSCDCLARSHLAILDKEFSMIYFAM